jgi:hypothetical protein
MRRQGERTQENGPPVLVVAKELAGFTLRVTSNEKYFPKRYRFSVVEKMQDRAFTIMEELVLANEIYPDNYVELCTRRAHMKEARASCRALMALAEVATQAFGVRQSTLKQWAMATVDLQKQITNWILSDDERFRYLMPKN